MDKTETKQIFPEDFPSRLKEIPDRPKKLFLKGEFPPEDFKWLAIVGSRKYSSYGRDVCEKLIRGLRDQPIVIISGLALGIDSITLETALETKLKTVGVPGSGLNEKVLYPPASKNLSERILENGGALISEFEPTQEATKWTFPQRNRIMAGLADAVLVIEAEEKSGTMITARLASEYNRDVLTVPGSIFSENTSGPHKLIKLGAGLIRKSEDILEALGLDSETKNETDLSDLSELEKEIWEILKEPKSKEEIFDHFSAETSEISGALSILEIKGLISESLGQIRRN